MYIDHSLHVWQARSIRQRDLSVAADDSVQFGVHLLLGVLVQQEVEDHKPECVTRGFEAAGPQINAETAKSIVPKCDRLVTVLLNLVCSST